MKILITGGAGYKGILLTHELLRQGDSVTVFDNFMHGFGSVLHLVHEPKLNVIHGDIRNVEEVLVRNYDVVYHLAAISGMPACAAQPHSAAMINVDATRRLVSVLSNQQLLIYASTTSVYGADGDRCNEITVVQPASLYAKTKYEAERIVLERTNSIALRFATVFGVSPKMRNDLLVNDFTYKAMNDRAIVIFAGRSKRTFIHISDAIQGYIFALRNADKMRAQAFNVGDEQLNFSKTEIAAAIRQHVKFEVIDSSLPDLDVRDFIVSFDRIKNLGYCVQRSLDDGIVELVKLYSFYRLQPHLPVV